MKTTAVKIAAIAMGLWGTAAFAGNYILTIDGKQYELDLGEPTTVTIRGDQKVQVKLEKKDVVVFETSTFAFSHPGSATPARTDLGDGVHQTMMASPTGSLVMIQEYSGLNPSGLVDLMLTELTKEEVQYGYEITKEQVSRTLADGRTVSGKRAISKYGAHEYERWVVCYGAKDAGIMIITQIEKGASRDDVAMLDLFWKTVTISLK